MKKQPRNFVPGLRPDFLTALFLPVFLLAGLPSCEKLDDKSEENLSTLQAELPLREVAEILSALPLGLEQMTEVHDAVSISSDNGFDEEYLLRDLFERPGSGMGEDYLAGKGVLPARSRRALAGQAGLTAASGGVGLTAASGGTVRADASSDGETYAHPLRDLFRAHLLAEADATRSSVVSGLSTGLGQPARSRLSSPSDVEAYIRSLCESDIQIYWPYSETWDGETLPALTFAPAGPSETNRGFALSEKDGRRVVEEITVTEAVARERPVWVVNRNDDGGLLPLDLIRKVDPSWGTGGGQIVPSATRKSRLLQMKTFCARRNYDSWFAGGSEFVIKIGSVESFTASTEAEMKLYNPSVTDFMICVRRQDIGVELPYDVVLVSDWTDQLSQCAFMIVEDDGGSRTTWNCTAVVKVNSKSYGVEISIPIHARDDIVWRGQLNGKYITANNNLTSHFGDVDLTFSITEY